MDNAPTTASLAIKVIAASPKQESVLAHLLELYMHDFSEFIDLKLDENARFGYKRFSLFAAIVGAGLA